MSKKSFKIYTKKGDTGETSLIGGTRVLKSHIRIEAYGTLDELNSFIGLLRDKASKFPEYQSQLLRIQKVIFLMEAHLATDETKEVSHIPDFDENEVVFLENSIDEMEKSLTPLKNFVLPGGCELNSLCHICRTICRRAERIIVALSQQKVVNNFILIYINRLSDYFFVLARNFSHLSGCEEIIWKAE